MLVTIIRGLLRKLGFDVVRYAKPKRIDIAKTDNRGRNDLISSSNSLSILEGVGRKRNNAFEYFERPKLSSVELDKAENDWWNIYGSLIERVWVLSDEMNELYRGDYVARASNFFRRDRSKAKVLDLGCGSGWFGRMMASQDLEYYGIDFSSTQIEIANEKKLNAENSAWLNYYCTQDYKNFIDLKEINSVVIHAFLHHLYWEELHKLFIDLSSNLEPGCRIFIVEPIYPESGEKGVRNFTETMELVKGYRSYLENVKSKLISKGEYDIEVEDKLGRVIQESGQNGFFFSPKEVPFKRNEFEMFLSKYVDIEDTFYCGILNIETAQMLENINVKSSRDRYKTILFPFVNHIDGFLISNSYENMMSNSYIFTGFECVLRK